MKSINNYIFEKLIINKNTNDKKHYSYFPKDKDQLKYIINTIIHNNKNNKIIDLNCINTSKITNMAFLFDGLTSIKKIDISDWDVSNVKSFAHMFYSCTNLISIGDLYSWNVSNVVNMSNMFYYCSKLKSIGDISKWNISKVTDLWCMFGYCNSLDNIGDLSSWNVENINDFSYMFYECTSLKNVGDLSSWKIKQDANTEHILFNCPAKKYANI